MFGFLKDKLKGALKVFSKGVDEKGKTEEKVVEVEKPVEKETTVEAKTPVEKKTTQVSKPIAASKPEVKATKKEEKLETKEKPQQKKVEEKKIVEKKEIETPQQAPQSLFSKFTSVFKKKEEVEVPPAKKEQPKMVVETKRITPDGKVVEERTVIQAKTDEQEEAEEKIKLEKQLIAEKENSAQEKALRDAALKEIRPVEEKIEQEKFASEHKVAEPEHKPSFFERITQVITTKTISEEQFEELFFDLEFAMLENNVAVQVIEKLKADLKESIVGVPIKRGDIEKKIIDTLRNSINDVLSIPVPNILKLTETKKPYVIAFIGVNGAGKTTNLAKVASYFKKNGKSVVIAACDTFRAAAIQQLEEHANRLDIKLIKHDYGADAAAVAFDAVAHAKSKNIDIVLIDTAGRLHSNSNLMDELAKIERVIAPDLKLFVGESVTGNDCIEQAMQFNEKVGIDGIILSKADVDEKGGAALSVSFVTQKPIFFIGTGQTYDDLEPFDKDKVLASLEL